MYNNTMYELGSQPSLIRELFAYGLEQAKIVGSENVFDYTLGNPTNKSFQIKRIFISIFYCILLTYGILFIIIYI